MRATAPPPPLDPMVARNPFREQTIAIASPPLYADIKADLPTPILPDHPEWVEMYWRAWGMAWAKLRRPKSGSGLVGSFIDNGDVHLDLWESAFMSQFGLYGRRRFNFMWMLDNFYARQRNDGQIGRLIHTETGASAHTPFDPNGSGPDVLAWAEWRYFRLTGDDGRLSRVFPPLLALHRWFRAHRTWPNGSYWATGVSSGLDNQNRLADSTHHHQHGAWVDATMQATLSCSILTKMAVLLKEEGLAAELTAEHTRLVQYINKSMWNTDDKFYQDVDVNGRFSPVKSIAAYWGLLDKELIPKDRQTPFIQHLREESAFKRPHSIPSISADSPDYQGLTGDRWHGGVWSATNFMVLKGLQAAGKQRLAFAIAQKHLNNIQHVYVPTDTFWEYYAPETAVSGSSNGTPARADFIGSTGLSPISILLEDVIGIRVDWPLRRVIWDRYLDTDAVYGIENYPLGQHSSMTLLGNRQKITVTTDVAFTLIIRDDEQNLQTAVSIGTTEISLE